ncbi:Lycopene elongase [Leucobacter sp. 7(1)]|uniref:prenyltransferase n=1 Tax=Leucobacter sp. 7(1) TaxID=1255613 RepID=UPI00097EB59F|nr:prenyltransferase [Leucobacter sp. 7(1)]SJN09990.1 Lycopene elongase [Leucobacter sp. 7(1)]
MNYLTLASIFVTAAVACAWLLARRAGRRGVTWVAVALAGIALLLLTAVFDTLMIRLGLFSYAPEHLIGFRIGLAPIEDFAYPLAIVIALPVLWAVLTKPGIVPLTKLVHQAWLASRPVSWINTAFPFAAALLLTTREISWVWVIGTLYYLVPYNIAMYGVNDVFDYESDLRNPRKGGIEGALLAPQFHRPLLWLVLATNVPFVLVLLAAGGPMAWVSLAVSTFALLAYSAPPLRLKERPGWDSVTSSLHFVSPAVVGLALGGATIDSGLFLTLLAFFLWGMAAHAFGAVQDIRPDRDAGIGSIATACGARRTVRLALALWLLAGLLMLATPWPGPLAAILALPYLVNCLPWINVTDDTATETNRAWRRFIWINYGAGFAVTLILILFWQVGT